VIQIGLNPVEADFLLAELKLKHANW